MDLFVGISGLRSSSSTKLVTLGEKFLRIVDSDIVEASNLQSQFLYREKNIGKPRINLAAQRLQFLNSNMQIEPIDFQLSDDTVDDIIKAWTVLLMAWISSYHGISLMQPAVERKSHMSLRSFRSYGKSDYNFTR